MSALLKPWTVDEFLDWEREQDLRWEFDGIQPLAMTGASLGHARTVARLAFALRLRLQHCEVFTETVKVRVAVDRIRYPDVIVVCGQHGDQEDVAVPTVVFEVLSPSTEPTDRRVKVLEYGGVPAIQAYALLEVERPALIVHRRSTGWVPEPLEGRHATLRLPEIDIEVPLAEVYPAA